MSTLEISAPIALPALEYEYNALEPYISEEIMHLHHSKHHQAYIDNFNKARIDYLRAEEAGDTEKLLSLQGALTFNGGGHVNHALFWQMLAPAIKGGGKLPSGHLQQAIDSTFGSLSALQDKMVAQGKALQGSGWVWLAYCPTTTALRIQSQANQDPLCQKGLLPILGIDVWEHAYYLQYKNARPKYLEQIWNVVNWAFASSLYDAATQK